MKRLIMLACVLAAFASPGVEVKRREITVSVRGLNRPSYPIAEASVEKVIAYWIRGMDREIGNKPDLIVLPECCDTVPSSKPADKARWIRMRGTRVLDAVRAYAAKHNAYIVYSAHREREDGRFANSSMLIDRGGNVIAVYDKKFPTIGEAGTPECQIVPGTKAVVAETDFGRVGFAICFDLNFDELKREYAALKPDIICFSSNFDGDFLQRSWARDCRAYMVSSTCSYALEKRIIDPAGGLLRTEQYYMPTSTTKINTNCRVIHLDYNREKFADLITAYGTRVSIRNPGSVGTVTLLSNDPGLPVDEVMRKFELEPYDDYLVRSRSVRESALKNN
jgi:predicted amidohydrolase